MTDELEQLLVEFINLRAEIRAQAIGLAAMEENCANQEVPYPPEFLDAARLVINNLQQRSSQILRRLQQGRAPAGSSSYVYPLI